MIKSYTISQESKDLCEATVSFWLTNPKYLDSILEYIDNINKLGDIKETEASKSRALAQANELATIKLVIANAVESGYYKLAFSIPKWVSTEEALVDAGYKLKKCDRTNTLTIYWND